MLNESTLWPVEKGLLNINTYINYQVTPFRTANLILRKKIDSRGHSFEVRCEKK